MTLSNLGDLAVTPHGYHLVRAVPEIAEAKQYNMPSLQYTLLWPKLLSLAGGHVRLTSFANFG